MRNWIAALVAACFAFSPMLCAWAADSAAASAAFGAGNDAFQLGDYRTALTRFEAARDAGIEGPAVHYNIGVCQYKLGKYRQAEGTFRLVAERYPQMRAVAEYNLGLALLRQQRRTEARAAFEEARGDGDEKIASLAQVMLQRLQASAEPASRS
jgi:tetratricopeptide (TPR) repeat protein